MIFAVVMVSVFPVRFPKVPVLPVTAALASVHAALVREKPAAGVSVIVT